MKFSEVTNRTTLYLLGGIAGLEGPLLNIIQTKNGKLFFEFCNSERLSEEKLKESKTENGFPIETHLPIYVLQETTLQKLKNLLSKESLEKNDNDGPFLTEFMKLNGNSIYLEKEIDNDDAEYLETNWNNKHIQSRMEPWLYVWNNLRLLDFLNWNFDNVPDDETILDYILRKMNYEE